MRKLIVIFFVILISTFIADRKFNYVTNNCYVYKFVDNTHITFVTRYNSYISVNVDTNAFNYIREHRKDMYKIRRWDYGKVILLTDSIKGYNHC